MSQKAARPLITLFGRKKQETQAETVKVSVSSRLQELCMGDEELYQALSNLMFLDPRKINAPLETILGEARDFETKGNSTRAEVSYRVAGGISLYKGDVEGVRNHFTRAASLAGDSRPEYKTIAKKADEAVSVAKKYYAEL